MKKKEEKTIVYDMSDFVEIKHPCEGVKTDKNLLNTVNPIREYSTKGTFIKIWPNAKYLAETENLSYSTLRNHLLKGTPMTLNKRIYLRGTDKIKDRLAKIQSRANRKAMAEYARKAQQINVYTSTGEYVSTFNKSREASEYTKVSMSNTNNSLNGKALVTSGYIFLTPFETIEERLKKVRNRKTWKTNL